MSVSSLSRQASPLSAATPIAALALLAWLGAGLAGCGPRSDRLAIGGSVMLDGAPLDKGTIRFTTKGEGQLQTTGALIRSGEYEITSEKGLLPGTYHVELNSPDDAAKPVIVRAQPGGPGIPVAPDRIPPQYNTESDKSIEVTRDGENRFDFAIESPASK